MTEYEFAARHFPKDQRAIAAKVRRLLAPYVPVNAGRIAPSDRLVEDLGLAARLACGLDAVEFVKDLEEEFKIEFNESDYYELKTFQDTVSLVVKKTATTDRD